MRDRPIKLDWTQMGPIAGGILACLLVSSSLSVPAYAAEQPPAARGVVDEPCPPGVISVEPGASIQSAVDRADDHAAFCLKNGVHRMQVVRPRTGQRFYGEGHTVLNGSRLLTEFSREGRYWVAAGQTQRGHEHGECMRDVAVCRLPEGFFIDDMPLEQVLNKESVEANRFFLDYNSGKLYFADDPTGRKVEATVAPFAFKSTAQSVLIRNMTVEKYASAAQEGAIHAREGSDWAIQNSEVRLNSGAGISIGDGGHVYDCDVHHNGQIGIEGNGRDIWIERNRIWSNNIYGFDYTWEAGGVKLALSDGVTFRENHVHDNVGPGLWCDIDCHNAVYEYNLVENNHDVGIFHEISSKALIRNNIVRHNGSWLRGWFWLAEIVIAASQNVEVEGNTLTVSDGGCGIVLIDQGRLAKNGTKYKTRNNTVRGNALTFEGAACVGGVSDVRSDDENFKIIPNGNNSFDDNVYRVPRERGPARFVWGHDVFDWEGFRRNGLERNGRLVYF